MKKTFLYILHFYFIITGFGQNVSNQKYILTWSKNNIRSLTYTLKDNNTPFTITLPSFEIEGKKVAAVLNELKPVSAPVTLKNGVTQYEYEGAFKAQPSLQLLVTFQVSPDNPVLRFQYSLKSIKSLKLTKTASRDNITYTSFKDAALKAKEVRFSEFNERFHATHMTEAIMDKRYFSDEASFMGPMTVLENAQTGRGTVRAS